MWQGLETTELADMAATLSFHDVVGSDGESRFLIRYLGQRIAEALAAACARDERT
jgi:hypothetical protein